MLNKFSFLIGAFHERVHVGDGVGGADATVIGHLGNVVRDRHSLEIDLPHDFHHLIHVYVTVIHECLDKMGQRLVHIAEVHLEDFSLFAEVADGLQHILPHHFAAFQPAAHTETHPDVGTVGDVKRAFIPFKVAEYAARNAAQIGAGRVVRVDADHDPRFLGNRSRFPDEMGEVVPDLLLGVFSPVGQFRSAGLCQIERSRLSAAGALRRALLVRCDHQIVDFPSYRAPDFGSTSP